MFSCWLLIAVARLYRAVVAVCPALVSGEERGMIGWSALSSKHSNDGTHLFEFWWEVEEKQHRVILQAHYHRNLQMTFIIMEEARKDSDTSQIMQETVQEIKIHNKIIGA